MSDSERLLVALWIVHAHCVEHFEQTPYLTVTSPQRQCGKSRLLELLELLVPRPWVTVMPSEAVVFRKIEAEMPTLLLDEVDAIFAPKTADRYEGLRAILNAGHRRGNSVSRCVNFGADLVDFRVYCAKVLAGIGVMPATITDRAVPVRLERKLRGERVERFRRREAEALAAPVREGIAAFAAEHGAMLSLARPEMPDELSDRMQEGCECLVAIADALGCGDEARAALVEVLSGDRQDEAELAELKLLADIRDIFLRAGVDRLGLGQIVLGLVSNGNGWDHWYGRGIQVNDVTSMVKKYGVKAVAVRDSAGEVHKGFRRDDLWPVFERYLPEASTAEVVI
jgi:hypothetical protein